MTSEHGFRLPDWPIVEYQFKAQSQVESAHLDKQLQATGVAYQTAAKATNELFRQAKPQPSEAQQKEIGRLYQSYNQKVDEVGKEFFKGQTPPLPRLRPLAPDQWQP